MRKILKLVDRQFRFGRQTLVFVQIPHCGGDALHKALADIRTLRYRRLTGRPQELEGVEELDGVGGHQRFGTSPLHHMRERLVYLTVLRAPLQRVLSFQRQVQQSRDHHLRVDLPGIEAASTADFIKRLRDAGSFEIANLQARMVTGQRETSAAEAIAHLEAKYTVVGVEEDRSSYQEPVQRLFPRNVVSLEPAADEGEDAPAAEVTPELEALIAETNGIDAEIHAHFAAKHQLARQEAAVG